MSAEVYANGHEISAKKDSNQSMGAMPDICLSPPSPPAGPIPIPYPNFSKGSNTNKGTKKVKIKKGPAGIKNKSNYKKSKGNEAATRNFGMGVVSHALSGKMQHVRWSMDVKFEGKNVIRQFDMTTHNHGSQTNGAITINGGKFKKVSRKTDCEELDADAEAASKKSKSGTHKPGRTFASAQYNPPSGAGFRGASSSHMSEMKNKSGLVQGNKDSNKFKETKMCANGKKKLPKNKQGTKYVDYGCSDNQGGMCHAESRVVEAIFQRFGAKPGGTVTFSIRQQKETGQMLDSPCDEHCKPMLCAAQECDITIKICKDGKAEDLEC